MHYRSRKLGSATASSKRSKKLRAEVLLGNSRSALPARHRPKKLRTVGGNARRYNFRFPGESDNQPI